jgi:hypothetical protein
LAVEPCSVGLLPAVMRPSLGHQASSSSSLSGVPRR